MRLLKYVRQLMREQRLAVRRVGRELILRKRDIRTEREGARADRTRSMAGRIVRMYAHVAQIRAETRFEEVACRRGERLSRTEQSGHIWIRPVRRTGQRFALDLLFFLAFRTGGAGSGTCRAFSLGHAGR